MREGRLQQADRHALGVRRLSVRSGRHEPPAKAVSHEMNSDVVLLGANALQQVGNTGAADSAGPRFHLVVRREVGDAPRRRLHAGQEITKTRRAAARHPGPAASVPGRNRGDDRRSGIGEERLRRRRQEASRCVILLGRRGIEQLAQQFDELLLGRDGCQVRQQRLGLLHRFDAIRVLRVIAEPLAGLP